MNTNVTCNVYLKDYQDSLCGGVTITYHSQLKDTVLLRSSSSQLSFPLSHNGADTLIFTYDSLPSLRDLIRIESTPYTHVDYPECGSYYFHNLKKAVLLESSSFIDTIEICNPLVGYDGAQNIKIHYKSR